MTNWRIFQHPVALMILAGLIVIFWCSILDGAYGLLNVGIDVPVTPVKNWPFIIASILWISIFTAGLFGCLLNFLRWLRTTRNEPVDAAAVSDLSEEEYKALQEWMGKNEMSMNRVITLWRAHHGSV